MAQRANTKTVTRRSPASERRWRDADARHTHARAMRRRASATPLRRVLRQRAARAACAATTTRVRVARHASRRTVSFSCAPDCAGEAMFRRDAQQATDGSPRVRRVARRRRRRRELTRAAAVVAAGEKIAQVLKSMGEMYPANSYGGLARLGCRRPRRRVDRAPTGRRRRRQVLRSTS